MTRLSPLSGPLAPVLLLLAAGCSGTSAPYPVGLLVTGTGTQVRNSVSYKVIEGEAPFESTGTVGSGESCSIAATSTGTENTTTYATITRKMDVVGETTTGHPLLPGEDRFDPIGVSIVADTEVANASSESLVTYNQPGSDPDSYEETLLADTGHTTTAGWSGVAADEYTVRLTSLRDLWEDLEDPDADVTAQLMTRHNPKKGDVWVALNGNTLYFYEGKEEVSVGSETFKADKVQVWAADNVDPSAGDLMDQCFRIGVYETGSTYPDVQDIQTETVLLDSGCEDAFAHHQQGTQWWYKDVLVKEELTTWEVTISDYGYEWYEAAEFGGGCDRLTSTVREDSGAQLYMAYQVTTIDSIYEADSWQKQ